MRDGWRSRRLGQLAEVERGVSWAKADESLVPEAGMIPVIRIGNVQPHGLNLEDRLYLRNVNDKNRGRRTIREHTILMVGSNGNRNRVGNVCRATAGCLGHVYASFLIGIHPIEREVDSLFLFHLLSSPGVQARISDATSGSTGLKNIGVTWLR